jgi:integrase/recombinase XerC
LNKQVFESKISDFLLFLDVEKNVSKHTLRAYECDLTQVLSFWSSIIKEVKKSKHQFEEILRKYIVSLYYKKISKTSLSRKMSTIRSFAKYLLKDGIQIKINLKTPRLDKKLPSTLTVDEIFYLLDSVQHSTLPTKFPYRDKAIFELIYATGIRCSELVEIKLQDISFEEKTIKISGKGRKQRIVLFGRKALERIHQYIKKERIALGQIKAKTALFLNFKGTKISSRSVQRIFEMFRKFLNIDSRQLTPHKIRHSFASHMLNSGANLRIIQELLGHKAISSTEIYTHISSKQLAKMCDEKHPLNKKESLIFEKPKD